MYTQQFIESEKKITSFLFVWPLFFHKVYGSTLPKNIEIIQVVGKFLVSTAFDWFILFSILG